MGFSVFALRDTLQKPRFSRGFFMSIKLLVKEQ